MAQKVQTILIDDIEGKEIKDGGQSVQFSIDGVDYEIDLSEKNATKMRENIQFYVDHARKVGGRRPSGTGRAGSARTDSAQLQKIREWAKDNGYQVSDRGRVPRHVQEAFQAAHAS